MNELCDSQQFENDNLSPEQREKIRHLYTRFNRPMTSELLGILNLDIIYQDGSGNFLTYQNEKNEKIKVLDLVGGYGANILGHKNQKVMTHLIDFLKNGPSNLSQGSVKKHSTILSKKLNDLLATETKVDHWITTFTNSGTETIEAALKLCLMYHFKKIESLEIINSINENRLKIDIHKLNANERSILLANINESTNSNFSNLTDIVEYNRNIIQKKPLLISFKGSFHGKTLGSLFLTSKDKYKIPFQLNKISDFVLNLPLNDFNSLEKTVHDHNQQIIRINDNFSFNLININQIAGCFIEPIQGEAGIIESDLSFIQNLKQTLTKNKILLVSDEIQCGLFRANFFSALTNYKIQADVYCFSKGLGGGVAKIGAMCASSKCYSHEFGYLHTSTFAEDEQSSSVANKVLDIINEDKDLFKRFNLKEKLEKWSAKYSRWIKPIRGQGYILGIEFTNDFAMSSYELKIFDNSELLGYLIASSMLHNSQVRVLPSLSSNRTLRIQPSLYFDEEEYILLEKALDKLISAVIQSDMNYFFGHIYPNQKIGKGTEIKPGEILDSKAKNPLAIFFCHMIDAPHAKDLLSAFKDVDDVIWSKKLSKVSMILGFSELYRTTLFSNKGEATDVILMASAITSKNIIDQTKAGNIDEVVRSIQDAIDYACDHLGATTIGLGQFTSIATKNGYKLNPRGLNITTGNAYTTALCVEATIELMNKTSIDKKTAHIGCVGMAGNIVSITACLLAEHCEKMTLIYHSELKQSSKFQKALIEFFNELFKVDSPSPFILSIKKNLPAPISNANELFTLVNILINEGHLCLSTDLNDLKHCHVIVTGTSSPKPFINGNLLREKSIIVDIGVPNNVMMETIENRKDLHYIQGGIAKLPINPTNNTIQSINTKSFPLEPGTSYACLSETIAITMNRCENILNTGDLNREMVLKAKKMAANVGFELYGHKKSKSF